MLGVCSLWISTVLGEWGRVVPTIRSAVQTTLRSLLRSDLVAELNQTVIDVQRTDVQVGTFHRRNVFYTVQTIFSIALHQPFT